MEQRLHILYSTKRIRYILKLKRKTGATWTKEVQVFGSNVLWASSNILRYLQKSSEPGREFEDDSLPRASPTVSSARYKRVGKYNAIAISINGVEEAILG
jgi:hypothetical protein